MVFIIEFVSSALYNMSYSLICDNNFIRSYFFRYALVYISVNTANCMHIRHLICTC